MDITEKFLDAMELLTTDIVKKASYDKTIEAQIISCEDASIGKYRCKYQDAIIYAYSSNIDIIYAKNSYVYILVPNGDMKKEKTILGTTDKLGMSYISQAQGDQAYNIVGNNCIVFDGKFYLNTINKNYKYILYKYNEVNEINLNESALNEYLKQSSSLIVGATFRTSIPNDRQFHGSYGIIYNLRFLDNTSNKEVIRSYIVDEDNMIDNPYRLLYPTRQYQIFDIDGVNFIRVESISIFNKDFFNATESTTGTKLISGDIEITNLEISGANRMLENEVNGLSISFYTPQGTFFTDNDFTLKTITAQVKNKGKIVSADQNIQFYWGFEDVRVTSQNEYYNKYLEKGWKCINQKNIVAEDESEESDKAIEWVPGNNSITVTKSMITARQLRFKVAAVYNGNIITKIITIKNLSSNMPILTIESSEGTQFYHDIGHPTLTCLVTNGQELDYKYYWAYESNSGVFSELPETTEENAEYENALNSLDQLATAIAEGTKFINAEEENLSNLQARIDYLDQFQRVEENRIFNVQINNITNFGTFKCSVYNHYDVYLGTASITLTNSFQNQNSYTLVINNGSMVFQYNENGIAPTSSSLQNPLLLSPLSFTIYDNLGRPIEEDIIKNTYNCQSRWEFPIYNTMLQTKAQNNPSSGTSDDGKYVCYDNKMNLTYGIRSRYDIKKQFNQIKLTVDYKGAHLTAQTDFTFAKQGQPGTNGTQYLIKLVPNTNMSNPPLYPMITGTGANEYILNYGLNSTNSETAISLNNSGYQFFKAELWHNGQLVWKGFSAQNLAYDGVTKPDSVTWSILQNKYGQTSNNTPLQDTSSFEIKNSSNGLISYKQELIRNDASNVNIANIIKCSIVWQNKTYYATIPIITAWVLNNNYRVGLADYSGFHYAIYTSDGMTPQYDNSSPFEFTCQQKINSIWEDISDIPNNAYKITYEPSSKSLIMAGSASNLVECYLLQKLTSTTYRQGLYDNQWWYRPASHYNGECVSAAVTCTYKQNNNIIGKIHIPIHFLLNKYGLSNLNSWDGNSVEIKNDGGYILAPQIGAGKKQNDNSFTGIVMGEVKEANKASSNIGLFGYANGVQSFFLNSENGSAILGKRGNAVTPGGQIIIDPQNNDALLYSDNFWDNYDPHTQLPISYGASNEKHQGLLINLSKSIIKFGSGKFYVDDTTFNFGGSQGITYNTNTDKITFGSNVELTWSNVTDADSHIPSVPSTQEIKNIANGEIQSSATQNYITTITENTITTEYINAKNITAASVKAGWLESQTIVADSVKSGWLEAQTITASSIKVSGSNSQFEIINPNLSNSFKISYKTSRVPGYEYWSWTAMGLEENVDQIGILPLPSQLIFSDGFTVNGGVTIQDNLQILDDLHVVNNGYIEHIYTNALDVNDIQATTINVDTINANSLSITNLSAPLIMECDRPYYKVKNNQHEGSLFISDRNGRLGIYDNTNGDWMIYMTNDTTTKRVYVPFVYSDTPASEAPNVFVGSSGGLRRGASSSKRYKHSIETLLDYKKILNIPVVSFIYNEGYLDKQDVRYNKKVPGFIAEDVYNNYPIAADFCNNQIEDWNVRYIVPPMLAVEQQHEKQIQQLRKQIDNLKSILQKILER